MLGCRRRLARRGLAPDGAALGVVLLREARAAVPAAWNEATVRAAVAAVNPTMTVGAVSAAARQLAQEVFKIMLLQKLTLASAHASGRRPDRLGGVGRPGLARRGAFAGSRPRARILPDATEGRDRRSGSPDRHLPEPPGKVDGRRAGARAGRPARHRREALPAPAVDMPMAAVPDARVRDDRAGRPLPVPRRPPSSLTIENVKYSTDETVVAAAAPNYGIAWVEVPAGGRSDDLTLRLVDDRPITGQIVDLEGKPVPGATLQVLQIRRRSRGRPRPLARSRQGQERAKRSGSSGEYLPRFTIAPAPKVTTDAEGRFRLAGIGRDRLVVAQLEGPTIVSQHLKIVTRPGEALNVPRFVHPTGAITTYYGAELPACGRPDQADRRRGPRQGHEEAAGRDHRSAATGWPMTRLSMRDIVRTTTDAQGRYRLVGMPKGEGNRIMVVPGNDQPYLVSYRDVPDSPGLDPVTVDIELKRGVWIEGKITDKVTGKPVAGARELSRPARQPEPRGLRL